MRAVRMKDVLCTPEPLDERVGDLWEMHAQLQKSLTWTDNPPKFCPRPTTEHKCTCNCQQIKFTLLLFTSSSYLRFIEPADLGAKC